MACEFKVWKINVWLIYFLFFKDGEIEEAEGINGDLNEDEIRKNLEKLASKKRGTPKASKLEKTKSPKPAKKVGNFFFLSEIYGISSFLCGNHFLEL